MNADQLHDALTLLPEELLQPVDMLRRKKPFPWKSILATAACLCLVVGLALGYAKVIAPASAEDAAYINKSEMPMEENAVNQSQAEAPSLVEVVEVAENYVMVVTAMKVTSDSCALRAPIKLSFEKLSEAPTLQVGQIIEIYWHTEDYDSIEHAITPYKIVISEEEEE